MYESYKDKLPESFAKRAKHYFGEQKRVRKGVEAWKKGDLETFGKMMFASGRSSIENYEARECCYQAKVTVLDDGTVDNEHRLGAVKDIAFALERCNITEPIVVVAGDNLTDFSLKGFVEYFAEKGHTCIMRHFEPSVEKLRRTGVIRIDEEDRVLQMQEKPAEPVSNWAVPPFYVYSAADLALIRKAVDEGVCNVDAPGDFIAWLCTQSDVYVYLMPGKRYDIGNLQSYEEICREYKGIE